MRRFALITATLAACTAAQAQTFNIDIDNGGAPFGAGVPANSFGGAAETPGYWNDIDNVPGLTTVLRGLNGALTGASLQTTGTVIVQSANDGQASGEFAKLMEDGWQTVGSSDSITCTITGLQAGAYFVFTYGDPPDSNTQETRVTINGVFANCGGSHNTNEFVQNVTHTRHMVELAAGQNLVISVTNNPFVGGSRAFLGGLQIEKLPQRLYVNDDAPAGGDGLTWATAFQNPGDAFGAVSAYGGAIDEIWVAAGTYYTPQVPILGYTFDLPDGVKIYGGFAGTETQLSQRNPAPNQSFLSGSVGLPTTDDNAWHVIMAWGCGSSTLLDGFTITGGNADAPASAWDGYGGGAYIRESQLTIRNCNFVGNRGWRGGAIAIQDSTPRIEDCYFMLNTAEQSGGAIYTLPGGAPKVVNCDFRANVALINYGGAIANSEGNSMNIANCRFMSNSADWGGGGVYTSNGNCVIANCTFTGNFGVADRGGAIHTFGDNTYLFVYNSTIVGNRNYQCGGIDAFAGAQVFVRNSIVYGNVDDDPATNDEGEQLRRASDSALTVSYCNVQGWSGILGGTGNFNAIVQFVDSDGPDNILGTLDDNLRLLPNSPCIDRGSNSLLPSDACDVDLDNNLIEPLPLDLDGNARRIDDPATADAGAGTAPIVDIGAYEFSPPCDLPADLDSDGDVDLTDLATLLSSFGTASGASTEDGDIEGSDGDVDLNDLSLMLSQFGTVCD